jgi:hypothetical protein
MPKINWLRELATGLVVIAIAGGFGLSVQSLATREQDRQAVAEASQQDAQCEPDDNYYLCADLNAQAGMRRATDALVEQANRQYWLEVINLALLIGTLGASVVATFVAARAVRVAQDEMENGLQPRLGCNIPSDNWARNDRPKPPVDPLNSPDLLDALVDETTFTFRNHGEAAAFLVMVHSQHHARVSGDGFPPAIKPWRVSDFIAIPEGNWVASGSDSQEFSSHPQNGTITPVPPGKQRVWFFVGFVVYEGLHGVRYLTRFMYRFDETDRAWYLDGPTGLDERDYNGSEKLGKKWVRRMNLDMLFSGQH